MGLDMFLYRKTYVKQWDHQSAAQRHEVTVLKGGQPHPAIKPERIVYVMEEVAYLRKANAIHNWFVTNVQNGIDECQEAYVAGSQLKVLLAEISAAIESKSTDKLPTKAGFFFGQTDYDEWYWKNLNETRDTLTALLAEPGADSCDYIYHSSW